jgi:hypothetical protein
MTDWETLKEKGNQEYKDKKYHSAISLYSDAIGKYYNLKFKKS